MARTTQIRWVIDLGSLINTVVKIETRDGFVRTGVLEAIVFTSMEIDGIDVGYPVLVKFDEGFEIPFEQILTMKPV